MEWNGPYSPSKRQEILVKLQKSIYTDKIPLNAAKAMPSSGREITSLKLSWEVSFKIFKFGRLDSPSLSQKKKKNS